MPKYLVTCHQRVIQETFWTVEAPSKEAAGPMIHLHPQPDSVSLDDDGIFDVDGELEVLEVQELVGEV